jgi:PAS domain S-box-containing protein
MSLHAAAPRLDLHARLAARASGADGAVVLVTPADRPIGVGRAGVGESIAPARLLTALRSLGPSHREREWRAWSSPAELPIAVREALGGTAVRAALAAPVAEGTRGWLILLSLVDREWCAALGDSLADQLVLIEGELSSGAERALASHQPGSTYASETLADANTALASITDGFFMLDREWRFALVNEAAERLVQRPRAELLGALIWDCFPQAADTAFQTEYERAMRDGVTVSFEEFFEPRDAWFAIRAYPSAAGLSVYFQDVTIRRRAEERLAATEAHYRNLVTKVPVGVYALDILGRFIELNPAAEAIVGQPASEVIGHSFVDVLTEAGAEVCIPVFRDIVNGERDNVELEAGVRRPTGEERLVAITATAIRFRDRVTGLHGIARDITEDRAREIALRESEEKFRQIAENVRETFWILSGDFGRIEYVSRGFEKIWGAPLGPLIERPEAFFAAIHPDDIAPVQMAMGQIHDAERPPIEFRIVRPDGEVRWLYVRGFPVRDEAGAIYRVVGTAEDVTEARDREARQRLLATTLDQLGEGVFLLTLEGDYVYTNQTYRELLGLVHPEVGTPWVEHCTTDEAARWAHLEHLRTAVESGRWSGRIRRRVEGSEVPFDLTLGRVEQADGETDLLFGILIDATEQIEQEQHLRWVERLAGTGTLVSGVAHELNNPLNAIINFAELLAMDEEDEERREDLRIIWREATRMGRIVADLRQIARIAREENPQKELVDLNDVVAHVVEVRNYRLKTANVLVERDLQLPLPRVHADRGQMEQVVLNLIVNAEQAIQQTERPGRLTIRTRSSGAAVVLLVEDEGVGIPEEDLARIFDPFFTTRTPGSGTGLGLSIVHSILQEHEGSIGVESRPGLGSTFRVELPASGEAPLRVEIEAALAAEPEGCRVLVVDDEPSIRRVLVRHLHRRGHAVEEANDGAAALDLVDRHPFDVILSDMRMPGLDGEGLLTGLKERGLAHRIIFMTGDAAGDGERLRELNVPVLLKPVELAAVTRAVEERAEMIGRGETGR